MPETLRMLIAGEDVRACRDARDALAGLFSDGALKRLHIEAETVDASEALEKSGVRPPDIFLLKCESVSGGLPLLKRFMAQCPGVCALMAVASGSDREAAAAFRSGASDVLIAPFTAGELHAALRRAAWQSLARSEARPFGGQNRVPGAPPVVVLSHELKAPLAAVEGYLCMLQEASLGDKVAAYRPAIERGLARIQGMRKLITDLLALASLGTPSALRPRSRVELVPIAREVIAAVRPEAEARRIALELHTPDAAGLWGDPLEIELILGNLLTNAVKYNRDGGRIDVSIVSAAGEVTLAVADTGIGLTPQETAQLFQAFVRVKNSKTRNIPGNGLGLSLVKKLVELRGGSITVSSEPEKGSVFTVVFKQRPA